jgi:hypothetical protein
MPPLVLSIVPRALTTPIQPGYSGPPECEVRHANGEIFGTAELRRRLRRATRRRRARTQRPPARAMWPDRSRGVAAARLSVAATASGGHPHSRSRRSDSPNHPAHWKKIVRLAFPGGR